MSCLAMLGCGSLESEPFYQQSSVGFTALRKTEGTRYGQDARNARLVSDMLLPSTQPTSAVADSNLFSQDQYTGVSGRWGPVKASLEVHEAISKARREQRIAKLDFKTKNPKTRTPEFFSRHLSVSLARSRVSNG